MCVFPIAEADSRYLTFLIPIGLLLLGVFVLVMLSFRGARASRFEVTAYGLQIRGDLYGRTIPIRELRLESARRVDFSAEPHLLPGFRRMGTGMPGYQAGWFRLRSGEKALLYLTDRSKAVYIPTTNDYSLLLSPGDPDGFLETLRQQAR